MNGLLQPLDSPIKVSDVESVSIPLLHSRADSIWRCDLTNVGNPIVKIGRFPDSLISTIGFPELHIVRQHLYIESWPGSYLIPSVNVAVSATQIVRYLLVVAILGCHQETGNVKHLQGNRRLFAGDHVVDLVQKEWWHTIKGCHIIAMASKKIIPACAHYARLKVLSLVGDFA